MKRAERKKRACSGGYIINILIHLTVIIRFCISPEGEFELWSRLCLGAFVIKPLVERVL